MASFFNNEAPKISPESTGVGPDTVEEVLVRPIEKLQSQLDVMVEILTTQGKLDAVQKVNRGSEVLINTKGELQQIVSGIEKTEEEEERARAAPGRF